jgi:hypothetical protein
MHEELIKNIRSIKQRLGVGVIITLNGTDHHLMNQLDKMEELVNKNFGLADVSGSVKIALLEQLEELSEHIPCEVYTKKVIEIKSNFNDC